MFCVYLCGYILSLIKIKTKSDHDNCKLCNNDLTVNHYIVTYVIYLHCFSCMRVAKRCFNVSNDSKLDTTMVKVVCKKCLKDSCQHRIEI